VVHRHLLSDSQQVFLAQTLGNIVAYVDSVDSIYLLPSKVQVLQIKEFLPPVALFGKERPQAGENYGLLLTEPLPRAVLVMPRSDWRIEAKWIGADGKIEIRKVRLSGSVILDKGATRLTFKLLRFSPGEQEGEARLISGG
jgi:hypothetical protein